MEPSAGAMQAPGPAKPRKQSQKSSQMPGRQSPAGQTSQALGRQKLSLREPARCRPGKAKSVQSAMQAPGPAKPSRPNWPGRRQPGKAQRAKSSQAPSPAEPSKPKQPHALGTSSHADTSPGKAMLARTMAPVLEQSLSKKKQTSAGSGKA
jgi:hypothetical protein